MESKTLRDRGKRFLEAACTGPCTPTSCLSSPNRLVTLIEFDALVDERYFSSTRTATGTNPWFDDLRRIPGLGPRLAVPTAARICEAGSWH